MVVGNVDGILAVFKGDSSSRPWRRAIGLGTVSLFTPVLSGSVRHKDEATKLTD